MRIAAPQLMSCTLLPVAIAAYRAEQSGEPYFRNFEGGRSREGGGGISRIRTSQVLGLDDSEG